MYSLFLPRESFENLLTDIQSNFTVSVTDEYKLSDFRYVTMRTNDNPYVLDIRTDEVHNVNGLRLTIRSNEIYDYIVSNYYGIVLEKEGKIVFNKGLWSYPDYVLFFTENKSFNPNTLVENLLLGKILPSDLLTNKVEQKYLEDSIHYLNQILIEYQKHQNNV